MANKEIFEDWKVRVFDLMETQVAVKSSFIRSRSDEECFVEWKVYNQKLITEAKRQGKLISDKAILISLGSYKKLVTMTVDDRRREGLKSFEGLLSNLQKSRDEFPQWFNAFNVDALKPQWLQAHEALEKSLNLEIKKRKTAQKFAPRKGGHREHHWVIAQAILWILDRFDGQNEELEWVGSFLSGKDSNPESLPVWFEKKFEIPDKYPFAVGSFGSKASIGRAKLEWVSKTKEAALRVLIKRHNRFERPRIPLKGKRSEDDKKRILQIERDGINFFQKTVIKKENQSVELPEIGKSSTSVANRFEFMVSSIIGSMLK